MKSTPEYEAIRLLKGLPTVEAQNILMNTPTREIAMSLLRLDSSELPLFLAPLSQTKATAVREELDRLRRIRIEPRQIESMAENLAARLKGRRQDSITSYLRPHRRREP